MENQNCKSMIFMQGYHLHLQRTTILRSSLVSPSGFQTLRSNRLFRSILGTDIRGEDFLIHDSLFL